MKTFKKISGFFLAGISGIVLTIVGSAGMPLQEKQLYQYVGMEKCASICHNNDELGHQFTIVRNSGHAKAYLILESKRARRYADKADITGNANESPVCLKCHTTGSGSGPASFTATYKREEGVTCEACHKSEFNPKTVLPTEGDCRKCHNDSIHKVAAFDYKERVARIAHPRPNTQKVTDATN